MDTRALPIIIGGCHRSGTSLVRRLIDAHSRIHCGPELPFFRDFFGAYENDHLEHLRFSAAVRGLLPEDEALAALGPSFIGVHELAARRAGKVRWADKSPDNVLYTDQWAALLADQWVFVHVVRNPLDTIASIAEIGFPLTLPPDLPGRIAMYQEYVGAGLAFEAAHPDRSFRLIYEELVNDPARAIGRLMRFVGEDAEPPQLAFNDLPHESGLEDPNVGATTRVHTESLHLWPTRLAQDDAVAVWGAAAALWLRVDPALQFVREPAVAYGS